MPCDFGSAVPRIFHSDPSHFSESSTAVYTVAPIQQRGRVLVHESMLAVTVVVKGGECTAFSSPNRKPISTISPCID